MRNVIDRLALIELRAGIGPLSESLCSLRDWLAVAVMKLKDSQTIMTGGQIAHREANPTMMMDSLTDMHSMRGHIR